MPFRSSGIMFCFTAWGTWGLWGPCSATCRGTQQRSRTCEHSNGKKGCPGKGTDSKPCNPHSHCSGKKKF